MIIGGAGLDHRGGYLHLEGRAGNHSLMTQEVHIESVARCAMVFNADARSGLHQPMISIVRF